MQFNFFYQKNRVKNTKKKKKKYFVIKSRSKIHLITILITFTHTIFYFD